MRLPILTFRANYIGRRWRTWYVIVLCVAASLATGDFLAVVFVALATIDVDLSYEAEAES